MTNSQHIENAEVAHVALINLVKNMISENIVDHEAMIERAFVPAIELLTHIVGHDKLKEKDEELYNYSIALIRQYGSRSKGVYLDCGIDKVVYFDGLSKSAFKGGRDL